MPLPADLDQLDADALRRLLIEQERDPLGPRAAIRAKTAMGVAAWDTSRGVKLLSDS